MDLGVDLGEYFVGLLEAINKEIVCAIGLDGANPGKDFDEGFVAVGIDRKALATEFFEVLAAGKVDQEVGDAEKQKRTACDQWIDEQEQGKHRSCDHELGNQLAARQQYPADQVVDVFDDFFNQVRGVMLEKEGVGEGHVAPNELHGKVMGQFPGEALSLPNGYRGEGVGEGEEQNHCHPAGDEHAAMRGETGGVVDALQPGVFL